MINSFYKIGLMKKAILLFYFLIWNSLFGSVPDNPNAPIYLQEFEETQFDDDIKNLAQKLNYDPVEIFNYVYEEIEVERYDGSRKGALSTLYTKRGNNWDQCSLLISLLRYSGIPSRYALGKSVSGATQDYVYVQAWVSTENYRGIGDEGKKAWLNLVPWLKNLDVKEGLDLFSNGILPVDLNFDFDEYISKIDNNTALERYEEKVQSYLNIHDQGKSIADILRKENIILDKIEILPNTLPSDFKRITPDLFVSPPSDKKKMIKLRFYKTRDKSVLLDCEFSSVESVNRRVVLDFVPASENDKSIIDSFGGIVKTPDGAAKIKPVIKFDGMIKFQGDQLSVGEEFFPAFILPGSDEDYVERGSKLAGTKINYIFDYLSVSHRYLSRVKKELGELNVSIINDYEAQEEYLGRVLEIMNLVFNLREYESIDRVNDLFHCFRYYKNSYTHSIIYTFPSSLKVENRVKLGVLSNFNIDVRAKLGAPFKFNTFEKLEDSTPIGELMRYLIMYGGSFNEGKIFEDFLDSKGLNTVKGLMVAKQENIPIVNLTSSDIENGRIPILENQPENQYSNARIDMLVKELELGAKIITPTQYLEYGGLKAGVSLVDSPDHLSFFYSSVGKIIPDGGGESGSVDVSDFITDAEVEAIIANALIEAQEYEELNNYINYLNENVDEAGIIENIDDDTVNADLFPMGDPVDMVKGEFYQQEKPDISIKSVGFNLEVTRYYRNQMIYNGPFGYGWVWNHGEFIIPGSQSIIYYDNKHVPTKIEFDNNVAKTPKGSRFDVEKLPLGYLIKFHNGMTYTFSKIGLLLRKEDRNGNFLRFEYDGVKLLKMVDSLGRPINFTYNSNGKIKEISDYLGRSVAYQYDEDDLISFENLEGYETRYEYLKNQENPSNNHNLSKYIMPNGDFLKIVYYKDDTVAYHENAKGDAFNFQYSRLNRYSETWNESGFYRKIFFNESNDVIKVMTEDKAIFQREYDEEHNLTKIIDSFGNFSTMKYDANRNMIERIDALENKYSYEYDLDFNKVKKVTDPLNRITRYEYDDNGNLVKRIDADGNFKTFEYDQFGNIVKATDAEGYFQTSVFGQNGLNKIIETDKNGNQIRYNFNNIGLMTSKIDGAGFESKFEYDSRNLITKMIDPLGGQTIYNYNKNGQLVEKIMPNGAKDSITYDSAKDIVTKALPIKEVDALGFERNYEYDEVGNLVAEIDKNGNETRHEYDEMNRRIRTYDALNNFQTLKYDGNSNLIESVDKKGVSKYFEYDALNRKTREIDREGAETSFIYDEVGNITETVNPVGLRTKFVFDSRNLMIKKIVGHNLPNPRETRYEYDGNRRMVKEVFPDSTYVVYAFDGNGNKVSKINFSKDDRILNRELYIYDERNLLIEFIDGNGNSIKNEYDALKRVVKTIDQEGFEVSKTYDEVGNVLSHTDKNGFVTKYSYNLRNERVSSTNAVGYSQVFRYDDQGNLILISDDHGDRFQYYFDVLNRRIGEEDAKGNFTLVDYDKNSNVARKIGARKEITIYEYNKNNQLIKKIDPVKSQTITEYNKTRQIIKVTNAKGDSSSIKYNLFGEQVESINALGEVVSFEYDNMGRRVSQIDGRGIKTVYQYDDLGRRTKTINAFGTVSETSTTLNYDSVGRLISQVNDLGAVTEYEYDKRNLLLKEKKKGQGLEADLISSFAYDGNGKRLKRIDPKGQVIENQYNAIGQLIAKIDKSGNKTEFLYDSRNRLVQRKHADGEITYNKYNDFDELVSVSNDSRISKFEYDENGQVVKKSNFKGVSTVFEYDDLGRIIKKKVDDRYVTRYEYDEVGNLVSLIDPKYSKFKYEYDKLGRQVKSFDMDGSFREFEYDENGNVVEETHQDGLVVTRAFDELNRLKSVEANGSLQQAFEYDSLSRMTEAVDYNESRKTNLLRFEYDLFNRLTKSFQNNRLVQKVYDKNSNISELRYSSGRSFVYSYNNNNLDKIWDSQSEIASFTYNKRNRRSSLFLHQPQIEQSISYNLRNIEEQRVYKRANSVLFDSKLSYDENNNIIKLTEDHLYGAENKDFSYDSLDRIENENSNELDSLWRYDAVGNWITTNQNDLIQNFLSNRDNEYDGFNYDGRGNLEEQNGVEYTYDWKNRLVEVRKNGIKVSEYTYDALNRRVTKSKGSEVTEYVYDRSRVIEEYKGFELDSVYVYGVYEDDALVLERNNEQYYYLKDHLFSIRAITNKWGEIIESYNFTAYGLMSIFDSAGEKIAESSIGNEIGYTGRRLDSESGLWYYRARHYSSKIGRFLQRDPAGYVDGVNMYAYVKNNPLRYLDPSGMVAIDDSYGPQLLQFEYEVGPWSSNYVFDKNILDQNGPWPDDYVFGFNDDIADPLNYVDETSSPFDLSAINRHMEILDNRSLVLSGDSLFNIQSRSDQNFVELEGLASDAAFYGLASLQTGLGAAEFAGGAWIALVTSPTVGGSVLGGAIALNGLDNFNAGIESLFTGQSTDTYLNQGLQGIGLSETQANVGEAVISFGLGGAGALNGLSDGVSALRFGDELGASRLTDQFIKLNDKDLEFMQELVDQGVSIRTELSGLSNAFENKNALGLFTVDQNNIPTIKLNDLVGNSSDVFLHEALHYQQFIRAIDGGEIEATRDGFLNLIRTQDEVINLEREVDNLLPGLLETTHPGQNFNWNR